MFSSRKASGLKAPPTGASNRSGGFVRAVLAQAGVALLEQRRYVDALELVELRQERRLQALRDVGEVAVRAAERLLDDLVDQSGCEQARRSEAERVGGV